MNPRFFLSVLVVFCLLALRPALAREWTDSSGTHKIEAELVKLDGEVVHLKKADGTIVKVPLNKLCEDDRKFVRHEMAAHKAEPAPTVAKPDPDANAGKTQSASTDDTPTTTSKPAPDKQQPKDNPVAAKRQKLEQLQKDLERLQNAPAPRRPSSQAQKVRAKRLEELQGQIAKLQEEIESADDADSASPAKPKLRAGADLSEAKTPAEIDPIVADLLKPTSTVYDKAGFKEYKFDATTKEVQAITPFKPLEDDKWFGAKDTGLFFVKGQLKGIRRGYANNNAAYVVELTNVFGKAEKTNVFSFAKDDWSQKVACHRFPSCLVYITANVNSRTFSGEYVQLQLFDRKYLTTLLDRDVKAKRRVLEAVQPALKVCAEDEFDWKKLPLFGDAAGEVGQLDGVVNSGYPVAGTAMVPGYPVAGRAMVVRGKVEHDQHRPSAVPIIIWGSFVAEESRSSGAVPAATSKRGQHNQGNGRHSAGLDDALYFVAKTAKEIWIVVNGRCIPGYERSFLLSDDLANRGQPIRHDVMQCNCDLAQELFPPKGDTIEVKADAVADDINVYGWYTKDGWSVFVSSYDKFYIHRLLKAKL